MHPGLFIVVEGPNRAGKSTLISEIQQNLKNRAVDVIVTREPGGTPMGEGLRGVLKNPSMAGGTFATALVFNGGRKEHIDKVITPAINRGAVVICDRYYISTEIYQGILAEDVTLKEREILQNIHQAFTQPDLTIFLLPDADVVAKRGGGLEVDRFEGDPRELAAYRTFAIEYSKMRPTVVIQPTIVTEGHSKLDEVLTHPVFESWFG